MNTKDLIRLCVPVGEPIRRAHEFSYGLPIGGVLATDNAGLPLRRLRSLRSAFWSSSIAARG